MSKNHPSDGILVFDRYYGRKPIPALLAVLRVLFCGLFSAAAMLYIFSQYELYVPMLSIGLYAGISAAVLSVLFIFVKRRYAIPALLLAAGLLIWHGFEEFWERFSYFVDEAMLLVEGRFLFPRGYLIHAPNRLSRFNPDYCEGLLLGSFILCSLYGLLVAATMARRIRPLPAALGFIALCVPMLLSERLELNMWLLPAVLFMAAAVSISINYRDGLAVMRGGGASYRSQIREEDKQFLKNTERAGFMKRTGMRLSHYSKYTASGFYCAAVFALVYCIGTGIFEEGSSIDYSELYTFVTSFGEHSDASTDEAEEDSSVSDYFTSPDDEDDHLNIASPGRGNGEVLRVTFTGDKNIYLRGDIGVDFEDNSWTSPVGDNAYWGRQFLSDVYRPAELLITEALMESAYGKDVGAESEITIEYLTETDVVFLPAYTADHSFYSNESFDIYGDYVVRVSDSAENYINSVQCTAVTLDTASHATAQAAVEEILETMEFRLFRLDDFYGVMFPEFSNYKDILEQYSDYAELRYSEVPEDMSDKLHGYLDSIGFYQQLGESEINKNGVTDDQLYRFRAAEFISRYLERNYTYSLNGGNYGDDMIMQFLTETKRGHCSLYASAMTLLLREAGVPARYCTGFSIYPKSVNGSTTVLKEKNLHAWVEIYLDDMGWITFDPTSAAVSGMGGQGSIQRPEREETFQPRPETREQPVPERTEESVRPNETAEAPVPPTEDKPPLWPVLGVIGAGLLTALAVFAVLSWRGLAKRADEAVRRAAAGSGRSIYAVTVDIIALCGIIPEAGQLPVDFYRSCDKRFGAGMERSSAVLEAAAFSGRETSDTDRDELYRILSEVYSHAMKQGGAVRKYRIRRLVISGLK